MAETDNPWKSGLEELFPLAMAFFLPEEAQTIAWARDHESLETELRPMLLQFQQWREDNPMPFVSVFEQESLDQKQKLLTKDQQILDQQQQLRDSCLRGIALGLKLKFKEEGQALFTEVQQQTDLDWLRRFLDSIDSADSLDDLRKLLSGSSARP